MYVQLGCELAEKVSIQSGGEFWQRASKCHLMPFGREFPPFKKWEDEKKRNLILNLYRWIFKLICSFFKLRKSVKLLSC
jgi:apolipoprotein N-acyltransferase